MKLTEEKLINDLLFSRNQLLYQNGHPKLLEILRHTFENLSDKIFIVDWIPEQGEDIFTVLIDAEKIIIVELSKTEEELPLIKVLPIGEYYKKYRLSKIDKRKIETAINLTNNISKSRKEVAYMHNQNLLQTLTTPIEYLKLLHQYEDGPGYVENNNEYWDMIPEYIGAKCPICGEEYREKIDCYSLRNWLFGAQFNIFSEKSPKKVCEHYFFTENFLHLNGNEPQVNDTEIDYQSTLPPEVPYIQTPILSNDSSCRVVFHSLPISRIEGDEFVPRYSLFMLSYFVEPSEKEKLIRILGSYGNNPDRRTFTPGPGNEDDKEKRKLWRDLKHWVKKGKLYWLEPDNPDLPLKNSPVEDFPYAKIKGNHSSQQYPKEED